MIPIHLSFGIDHRERVYRTTKSYLEANGDMYEGAEFALVKLNMVNGTLDQIREKGCVPKAYTAKATIEGISQAFSEVLPGVQLILGDALDKIDQNQFAELCDELGYNSIDTGNTKFVNLNYHPEKNGLPKRLYVGSRPLYYGTTEPILGATLIGAGDNVLFVNVAYPKSHNNIIYTGILKNIFGLSASLDNPTANYKWNAHSYDEKLFGASTYSTSTRILQSNLYYLVGAAAEVGLLDKQITIFDGAGAMSGRGPCWGGIVPDCNVSLVGGGIGAAFLAEYLGVSLADFSVDGKPIFLDDIFYIQTARERLLPERAPDVEELLVEGLDYRDSPRHGAIAALEEGVRQGIVVPCDFKVADLEQLIGRIPSFVPHEQIEEQLRVSRSLFEGTPVDLFYDLVLRTDDQELLNVNLLALEAVESLRSNAEAKLDPNDPRIIELRQLNGHLLQNYIDLLRVGVRPA